MSGADPPEPTSSRSGSDADRETDGADHETDGADQVAEDEGTGGADGHDKGGADGLDTGSADGEAGRGSVRWLYLLGILVFGASLGAFGWDVVSGHPIERTLAANAVAAVLLVAWAGLDSYRNPDSAVTTRGGAVGTGLVLVGLYLFLGGLVVAITGLVHGRWILGLAMVAVAIPVVLVGVLAFPTEPVLEDDEAEEGGGGADGSGDGTVGSGDGTDGSGDGTGGSGDGTDGSGDGTGGSEGGTGGSEGGAEDAGSESDGGGGDRDGAKTIPERA